MIYFIFASLLIMALSCQGQETRVINLGDLSKREAELARKVTELARKEADLVKKESDLIKKEVVAASVDPPKAVVRPTPVTAMAGAGEPFALHEGTPVRLRLNRNVSSADAHVGDTIDFEVLDEVKVQNIIVVKRGALALGSVTEAKPKGRMGNRRRR
ncbi:MAG: hypothetical protein WKF37_11015 [Bryobacteraceae bacterium]